MLYMDEAWLFCSLSYELSEDSPPEERCLFKDIQKAVKKASNPADVIKAIFCESLGA